MVVGVRARLLDSIRQRMRADVPVGIYLSGGIDSSVVAGMAHHLQTEVAGGAQGLGSQGTATAAMTCFSVGFDMASGSGDVGRVPCPCAQCADSRNARDHQNAFVIS